MTFPLAGHKNISKLLILAALSLAVGPTYGQMVSSNGSIAFPILSVGLGARAIGMGESFTAVADDFSAAYYNPAGLVQIEQPEITLSHNLYLVDGFYDNIGGVYSFGAIGTLAVGASYLNYGSIDKRDNFGNLLGNYTPFDFSAEGVFGFPVEKDLSLGLSSQWINQNINGSIQAGLLWNMGFLWTPSERISFGFNMKNLGVETGGNSLPGELLWGAAYRMSLAKKDLHSLLLSGGGDLAFQSASTLNAGFEYGFQKTYFLRGGYDLRLQDNQLGGLQGLDFGAGVRVGQLQFDYSFSFEGDFGNIQRFSLSLFFAPLAKAASASNATASNLLPPPLLPGMPLGVAEGLPLPSTVTALVTAPVTASAAMTATKPSNQPVMLRFQVTSDEGLTAQQLFDQGEQKLKLGLKQEAMELYLKAVDKDPNFEPAWNRLGRLFFDKSLDSYRKALELDPQNEHLREWLNHFQPTK